MEPSVVVALLGAALAVVIARGLQSAANPEAVPVRVEDDDEPGRR
jgi:hypothetical protein